METPDKDGVKLINRIRQHVESGGTSKRLENRPKFPEGLEHVWGWFCELESSRQNGMAINPISYTEILSWSILTGTNPIPIEVHAIKVLDQVRLSWANKDG